MKHCSRLTVVKLLQCLPSNLYGVDMAAVLQRTSRVGSYKMWSSTS